MNLGNRQKNSGFFEQKIMNTQGIPRDLPIYLGMSCQPTGNLSDFLFHTKTSYRSIASNMPKTGLTY